MTSTPRVLFVCVKNAGKSQMAAGLMRRAAGGAVVVESAGTHPGDAVNPLSAEALREVGVDITAESPRALTPEMAAVADLVVVLGREAVVDGAGTPVRTWVTDEPSRRGIDGIERMRLVRDDIAARVEELARELTARPARGAAPHVAPVRVRDPAVLALLDALTAELAGEGYAPSETFGYSPEQLERSGVHLLGATVDGRLVGVAGVELGADGVGELKRFYVVPEHRGTGVADALLAALADHAAAHGSAVLRLETGDRQHAAMAFYRRHGFVEVPRFGPYAASATSVCMERRAHPRGVRPS